MNAKQLFSKCKHAVVGKHKRDNHHQTVHTALTSRRGWASQAKTERFQKWIAQNIPNIESDARDPTFSNHMQLLKAESGRALKMRYQTSQKTKDGHLHWGDSSRWGGSSLSTASGRCAKVSKVGILSRYGINVVI